MPEVETTVYPLEELRDFAAGVFESFAVPTDDAPLAGGWPGLDGHRPTTLRAVPDGRETAAVAHQRAIHRSIKPSPAGPTGSGPVPDHSAKALESPPLDARKIVITLRVAGKGLAPLVRLSNMPGT